MNRFTNTLVAGVAIMIGVSSHASAQGVSAPLNTGGPNATMSTTSTSATGKETSATGATPNVVSTGTIIANVASNYRIGVDDTISIAVSRHSDVSGTYRIAPDGLIHLPRLVTAIDVRDKTAADLVDCISKQLVTEGKLVIRPGQVTVTVIATRVRPIFVRGNAVHGSQFDLKNGWRVDDLIALMGSLPQPDRLTATLTNPAHPGAIPIDLDAALKNPASTANVALTEGDTLTIDQPGIKRLMVKGEGPKGLHEVDERFGLRQALISMGFTTNGATGDLRNSRIIRYEKPGDATTPATVIPVNLLTLLSQDSTPEIPFHDLDTLEIPVSDQYVYILGEIAGPRKWYLPQDRKTFLIDVYSNAGDVTGNAKIGSIKVTRLVDGKYQQETYDLGKFVKNADPKNNPEIYPHDMIYVPTNIHVDPVATAWTAWGLFSIFKALSPNL